MGNKVVTPPRRLTDLYVVAKEVSIHDLDPDEPPIELTVVKLNRSDMDSCRRRGNAAKAQMLMAIHDPDSLEYLDVLSSVAEQDNQEILANWVVMDEVAKAGVSIRAELESKGKWGEDGYYSGLVDAWFGGLNDRWDEDHNDPEAVKVLSQLTDFENEYQKLLADERDGLVELHIDRPMADLAHEVTKIQLKSAAEAAWMEAFAMYRIYYSTRQGSGHKFPARAPRYFESVKEVEETPEMILQRLDEVYKEIEVSTYEGKDSQGTPDSSTSSESSEPVEASTSSGPEDASA